MLPRSRWVCAACNVTHPDDAERLLFRSWASGYLMFSLPALWIHASSQAGDIIPFLMVQAAFLGGPAIIAIHEAGHAIAAKLVGGRICGVEIGRGPTTRSWRIFGVDVELKRYFCLGGSTKFAWRDTPRRWRLAAVIAAGPAANLGAAVLAFVIGAWLDAAEVGLEFATAMLAGWGLGHLATAFVNLWPGRHPLDQVASDGAQLLGLLRARSAGGGPYDAALAEGQALLLLRQFEEAQAFFAEAWRERPDDAIAPALLLHALSNAAGPDAALAFIRDNHEMLDLASGSGPSDRAFLEVNMADAALRAPRPDLELAAAWAERAFATAESWPPTLGTQGLVLVRKGQTEAGTELLLRAARTTTAPADRAIYCAGLAEAAQASGDLEAAAIFESLSRRAQAAAAPRPKPS